MSSEIKYSTIIPAYNSEKTIKRCIDSLLCQNEKNFEIIVINDGSTDNTFKILNKYCDKRLIVKSITNHGVSYARNIGINLARGKYITFVDSDDYVVSNYYYLLEYLTNKYNSEFYICCAYKKEKNKYDYWDLSYMTGLYNNLEPIYNLVGEKYTFPTLWNKIYLNSIIKNNNIKFDENKLFGEDLLFNLEYVKYIKNVYMTKLSIYYYCINKSSATFNQKLTYLNDRDYSLQKMIEFCKKSIAKFDFENNLYNIFIDKYYTIIYGLYKNKHITNEQIIKNLENNISFRKILSIKPKNSIKLQMQKAMISFYSENIIEYKKYILKINLSRSNFFYKLNKIKNLT